MKKVHLAIAVVMIGSLTYPETKHDTLLERIGNTPLIRLDNVAKRLVAPGVQIYAKAEWFNPGGSVKDRAALNMIREGEKSGDLNSKKTIIDATSGNTGIAYAMLGAFLGYKVELAVPANASAERKRILSAYGAEVIYTNPLEGTDGAQSHVKKIVSATPEKYFYPDQYSNPANWQAHYKTTAAEIMEQTDGRVTHFVSGLGTTGTFVGTSRRLKECNPRIRCISFQPDMPMHGLEGLKHLATAKVPGIYDGTLADENVEVSTDESFSMIKRLARDEGLLVGISSGAALVACIKIAQLLTDAVIVTIFSDHGTRYLSHSFWES